MEPERDISLIEAPPFHKDYGKRKFFMASEEERKELKQAFPQWTVRVATEEEILSEWTLPSSHRLQARRGSIYTP